MVQISKKLLTVSILFVFLIAGSVWGYFTVNKIMKSWDDSSTWSAGEKIELPVQATSNFKITTEEKDGKYTISIPFCILFNVNVVDENRFEYECSAMPLSYLELTKRFPEQVKLKDDIVISFDVTKDALPTKFLSYNAIDKTTIGTIGSDVKPVSVSMTVDYEKPTKNLTNILSHYQKARTGQKDGYVNLKVSHWSIDLIKEAKDYTEAERKVIIENWRKNAWEDVNNVLETSSFLSLPNTKELVDKMAPPLAYRSVYCPTAKTSGECVRGYNMNAATNILYYAYAASSLEKKSGEQVAEALRDRVIPFVYQYNEELSKYYETCDIETECTYFHRMEVYDYPACPINEIGTKEITYTKSLFMDYRFIVMDAEYLSRQRTYEEILAEHQAFKKQLVDSGIRREFNEGTIALIDKFCFLIFTEEQTIDPRAIDSLKDLYMTFVLAQIYINNEDFLNQNDRPYKDVLFDLVLHSSVYNPYAYSFVPQPYTGFSRLLSGVQLEDKTAAPDGYWSSLNATLILLYLTAQ